MGTSTRIPFSSLLLLMSLAWYLFVYCIHFYVMIFHFVSVFFSHCICTCIAIVRLCFSYLFIPYARELEVAKERSRSNNTENIYVCNTHILSKSNNGEQAGGRNGSTKTRGAQKTYQ